MLRRRNLHGCLIIAEDEKKGKEEKKEDGASKSDTKPNPANRILKGVMRVGALAKGLLLQGQLSVELVVLCAGMFY